MLIAPNLVGPSEIRAVAEAVAPVIQAERLQEEELAPELGIPDYLVGTMPSLSICISVAWGSVQRGYYLVAEGPIWRVL